jgi:subtilisin family serine protease
MSIGITPTHAILGATTSASGPITSLRYAGNIYNTSTWGAVDFAYPSNKTGGSITGTGMFVSQVSGNWGIYFPTRYDPMEADIVDLINAGVIVVVAAGNEYSIMENYSDNINDHYNDYIVVNGFTFYPRRGGISTVEGCICVGSIDTTVAPRKSDFSNTGPRIDIFAPGSNIASSSNTNSSGVRDSRNTNYYKILMSGTSMACPQVTGILACLLEVYPDLDQSQALDFLNSTFSKSNQLSQTGNAELYLGSYYSLAGAENRYLFCQLERKVIGNVYPKQNTKLRPSSGQAWPRSRIKRI